MVVERLGRKGSDLGVLYVAQTEQVEVELAEETDFELEEEALRGRVPVGGGDHNLRRVAESRE